MHLSQQGLELLKQFEGLELKAYQDSAGIWTIGYGDTGPSVSRGITITKQEAEERLKARLTREFEPGVVSLVKVPLTQNQFDALVCFAYNVGIQALRDSTLLKKWTREITPGQQTSLRDGIGQAAGCYRA